MLMLNGKKHYKWWFSIALFVYQRVFQVWWLWLSTSKFVHPQPVLCTGQVSACHFRFDLGIEAINIAWNHGPGAGPTLRKTVDADIPPKNDGLIPSWSMYGIFTYIWVIYGVHVGKYTIHGSSGYVSCWTPLSTAFPKWASRAPENDEILDLDNTVDNTNGWLFVGCWVFFW